MPDSPLTWPVALLPAACAAWPVCRPVLVSPRPKLVALPSRLKPVDSTLRIAFDPAPALALASSMPMALRSASPLPLELPMPC